MADCLNICHYIFFIAANFESCCTWYFWMFSHFILWIMLRLVYLISHYLYAVWHIVVACHFNAKMLGNLHNSPYCRKKLGEPEKEREGERRKANDRDVRQRIGAKMIPTHIFHWRRLFMHLSSSKCFATVPFTMRFSFSFSGSPTHSLYNKC